MEKVPQIQTGLVKVLLNSTKVLQFASKASTRELLDRVTLFRKGMETEAIEILEKELSRRGVSPRDCQEHQEKWAPKILWDSEGLPRTCCKCQNPATSLGKAWVRFFGLIPLIPYRAAFCEDHLPKG